MSSSLHQQALSSFLRALQKDFSSSLEQVILFGSFSQGTSSPESDIDLLVIISQEDFHIRRAIISLSADIFLQYGIDVSPKVLSLEDFERAQKNNNLFIKSVLSEGEVLV